MEKNKNDEKRENERSRKNIRVSALIPFYSLIFWFTNTYISGYRPIIGEKYERCLDVVDLENALKLNPLTGTFFQKKIKSWKFC